MRITKEDQEYYISWLKERGKKIRELQDRVVFLQQSIRQQRTTIESKARKIFEQSQIIETVKAENEKLAEQHKLDAGTIKMLDEENTRLSHERDTLEKELLKFSGVPNPEKVSDLTVQELFGSFPEEIKNLIYYRVGSAIMREMFKEIQCPEKN